MSSMKAGAPEIAALRGMLARSGGRAGWRELERVADSPEFRKFVEARHPSLGPALTGPGRRRMLQIMAASFAFGGLGKGARAQNSGYSEIVPYVRQPTGLTPMVPLTYASATLFDGIANGALVTTIDGRPIKIEGNPDHPWSRGATDLYMQASVLGLYDPDRSQAVQHFGGDSDWDAFQALMTGRFAALQATHGHGLHLLTGPVSSPSLIAQIQRMQKAMPEMHWHVHASAGRDEIYGGAQQAFGKPVETRWNFDKAELIVSLDGDFLDAGPHQAGASRAWVEARRNATHAGKLLPMHAVAPLPTLTYAKADFRTPVAQRELLSLASALLAELSGGGQSGEAPAEQWRSAAATALGAARGRSIVLTGAHQPAELHAVVHRINAALGNTGKTTFHTDPVLAQAEPFEDLVNALRAGQVAVLVMLDTNPVYTAPADAEFATLLPKAVLKVHAGLHVDETATLSDWHLPLLHPMESWGDARALDGTVTLIQPTIRPLYDGRSPIEILSMMLDPQPMNAYDSLRAFWRTSSGAADFEAVWHQMLLSGFVHNSAFPAVQVQSSDAPAGTKAIPSSAGLEVLLRPDPTIWDGSVANNAWLQELPKPLTKTVWENVITLAPKLAAQHKLANGDIAVVQVDKQWIAGPVWIQPGQHPDSIGLQLGYGRQLVGSVGENVGYNAYKLRRFDALWQIDGATLRPGNGSTAIATAQQLDRQEGHDYVRMQPVGGKPVGDNSAFTQPTLYNRVETDGRAWGMVIDLDACTGCNACVVACQAENNVPVIGKDEFLAGRDMHWLRVDRYHTGPDDTADARFLPVPCMNCEQAPCELGCPVEATLHDAEGLNLMVYNRCVGTRACSAYCPYKVRHFNFLHYSDAPASIQAQRNPEVTVRARGVMEKCTYCVQRIVAARIAADTQHRPIHDGEVVTACAAACPTQAIAFGDLADKSSAVAAARKDPRNYALLGELNTRPRTTYLAAFAPPEQKA
jgi:Fe-S-cluster-containing dehydrogenase component/anaerobic selenocysteine-containing dehydrogenase